MKPKIRFKGFEGEWKEERLSEISSSIASGKNIDHKGPYPLYGSTGIIGTTDKPYHEGPMLLVARVGANAGFLQLVNEKCGVSDNTLIVKPKDPVTDNYLFQYFKFFNLNRFIYGSGQPLITGGMLKKMPVRYGLKEERETLIDYFTSLDSQISASTSRLASLKQMKAASLQAMFPQEGETVPKIRFKGFKGEWNISRLGDFSTSFSGGTPTAGVAEFYGGEIPFIRSGEIHENRTELFLTEAGINNSSAKVVEKGTLLYALYGATSGEVGISKIKGAINQAILAIYPNKSVNKIFLSNYLQLKKQRIVGEFLQGGQGNLSGALVKSILVTYPSLEEQQAIASYFTSLDRQISLQSQRLEKLKQIKSACLDKMFI